MSFKRAIFEPLLAAWSRLSGSAKTAPATPRRIFVLRNSGIGDLLVVTPLFQALKELFPEAEVVVGTGPWSAPVLENNPYVDSVIELTAPWTNHVIPGSTGARLAYIAFSEEIERVRSGRFDIGIDVLGSRWGAMLMLAAGIKYRLGVRGYAGGHSATQAWVDYDENKYVGAAALEFAGLLGLSTLPDAAPQLYLTDEERQGGETLWRAAGAAGISCEHIRVVVAPAAGFAAKCWPLPDFCRLVDLLLTEPNVQVSLIGAPSDSHMRAPLTGERDRPTLSDQIGKLSLRQTFALIDRADLVICNSSMAMHAAQALAVPTIVVLGDYFPSAAAHNKQWVYDRSCVVVGGQSALESETSPEAVLAVARSLYSRKRR